MKVQIREIRGGKIKTVEKRYAEILVKLKTAEYYEAPENHHTYQTKVLTPAPAPNYLLDPGPVSTPEIAGQADASDDKAPASETVSTSGSPATEKIENPLEVEQELADNNDEEPKRRGRPRKNTYETKVLTAEE